MVTMNAIKLVGPALALALWLGTPAMGHHSGAMYDSTNAVTFAAVVKTFEWTNPHIRITVIADQGGKEAGKTWLIESTSPGNLTRDGWTKDSLKPGDHIELTMYPAKSGSPIGNLKDLKNLDTGRTLRRPPL